MLISEAIAELQNAQNRYGDLPIIGGSILDDDTLYQVLVLDGHGCKYPVNGDKKSKPEGYYLEGRTYDP